ncbi:Matrixin [Stieleria varia]|uniref:Matrixin n=2 Tax=Stieleria varia TaxID=2528005 RepID=A0A5C6AX38_9BACT|nr:Matrixin [Stieleria varia]
MLYAVTALPWPETDLSYSVAPDGTLWDDGVQRDVTSVWRQTFDRLSTTDQWQRYVAIAFQTWANHSNLNFHLVDDDGAPVRELTDDHGDIRFGAVPDGPADGWASGPVGGLGGHVTINADRDGADEQEMIALLTHEIGHALGLLHSRANESVMRTGGYYEELPKDDILGIQALYGARRDDSFDQTLRNDSDASASRIDWDNADDLRFRADLTSHADVDFYHLVVPENSGSITLSADARQLSLLAPKLQVFDASGNLLGSAIAEYGGVATVDLTNLAPGQVLTVSVDGASDDVFGMGAYHLQAVAKAGAPTAPRDPVTIPSVPSPVEVDVVEDPPAITPVESPNEGPNEGPSETTAEPGVDSNPSQGIPIPDVVENTTAPPVVPEVNAAEPETSPTETSPTVVDTPSGGGLRRLLLARGTTRTVAAESSRSELVIVGSVKTSVVAASVAVQTPDVVPSPATALPVLSPAKIDRVKISAEAIESVELPEPVATDSVAPSIVPVDSTGEASTGEATEQDSEANETSTAVSVSLPIRVPPIAASQFASEPASEPAEVTAPISLVPLSVVPLRKEFGIRRFLLASRSRSAAVDSVFSEEDGTSSASSSLRTWVR